MAEYWLGTSVRQLGIWKTT